MAAFHFGVFLCGGSFGGFFEKSVSSENTLDRPPTGGRERGGGHVVCPSIAWSLSVSNSVVASFSASLGVCCLVWSEATRGRVLRPHNIATRDCRSASWSLDEDGGCPSPGSNSFSLSIPHFLQNTLFSLTHLASLTSPASLCLGSPFIVVCPRVRRTGWRARAGWFAGVGKVAKKNHL